MAHLMRSGAGHLVKIADGHLSNSPNLEDCYKFAGYNDGDLTACAGCNASGDVAWTGTFYRFGAPELCRWLADYEQDRSIDGKELLTNGATSVIWNITEWRAIVWCNFELLWLGTKAAGDDPTGVYTRGGGCDLTANMTIVAC